ncbi:MAG: MarR family transcriptional regulator [Methylocystaceae bacterium]|nr:MarR family transcriptional regulator [Methylocystaceae bacterium]
MNDKSSKVTQIILEIFRLNGCLINEGNELVKDLGITSARWQVLGALSYAQKPLTVPEIAHDMGLTRQAVQRLVNEMTADDFVTTRENINHKRSRLIELTKHGQDIFNQAMKRQNQWAEALAKGFSIHDLNTALELMTLLRQRLEQEKR